MATERVIGRKETKIVKDKVETERKKVEERQRQGDN